MKKPRNLESKNLKPRCRWKTVRNLKTRNARNLKTRNARNLKTRNARNLKTRNDIETSKLGMLET